MNSVHIKSRVMKSLCSLIIPTLLFTPVLSSASDDNSAKEPVKWSYGGANGQAHWGDLSPEFSMCKQGKNQSPIDISKAVNAKLKPIKFDYAMMVPENVVNTGQSIQVNIRSGGSIKIDNDEFFLKQFHFHSPSENMIDHKNYPLEAQFVHANDEGELAIVSVLYQPGNMDNLALNDLLKRIPMEAGGETRLSATDTERFERKKSVKNYFRYSGSLTTPPCTEGVRWFVMQSRPGLSKRQLLGFQKALQRPNNRKVQPLNARVVTK
ncbi:MAG: carbonic anhydrase family protein [Gammaproteobacteria bacterium]|nr:carbonic anhydrase family protein [Gammaproteobacteria bacterium]